jgi:Arc/MetJ-type ribon-helix-helix transcriptional regulator
MGPFADVGCCRSLFDENKRSKPRPLPSLRLNRPVGTREGNLPLDIACQCFTVSSMRIAKTVSITLPPDLLVKAQEFAQREHRTMSELFREALRRYMTGDTEWVGLLQRTRARGKALGVGSEADVERLSDEFRRDKR